MYVCVSGRECVCVCMCVHASVSVLTYMCSGSSCVCMCIFMLTWECVYTHEPERMRACLIRAGKAGRPAGVALTHNSHNITFTCDLNKLVSKCRGKKSGLNVKYRANSFPGSLPYCDPHRGTSECCIGVALRS